MFNLDILPNAYIHPFTVGAECLAEGGDYTGAGVILVLGGVFIWLFTAFIFKICVFDVVFPRLQTIDRYKNRTLHCRLFFRTEPEFIDDGSTKAIFCKPDGQYYWCKFKLFPINEWHKVLVPYDVKMRRFPWTISLYTERINLMYDKSKDAWNLTKDHTDIEPENLVRYKTLAMDNIGELADNVIMGVKGDYGLIKDKFKLGLSVQKTASDDEDDRESTE